MDLKRYLQVLAAVAAVFSFVAIAAGAAQASAPRFTVAGKTPIASESFTFTAKNTQIGKFEIPGLFTLLYPEEKCTLVGSIVGSAANQPGTAKEVVATCTVEFEGAVNSVCTIHSPGQPNGTVVTAPLKGTLMWLEETGDATGVTFTPESGGSWLTAQVTHKPGTGEVCPLTGNFPTTGSVIGKVETPTTDKEVQSLEFPNPPIGGDKVSLGGKSASLQVHST